MEHADAIPDWMPRMLAGQNKSFRKNFIKAYGKGEAGKPFSELSYLLHGNAYMRGWVQGSVTYELENKKV